MTLPDKEHTGGLVIKLKDDLSLRIKRYLGRGSVGAVFLATLQSHMKERPVAAKVFLVNIGVFHSY